jgi:cytochrome o ubiquinol oxidase operon protein cyoD
MKTLYTYIIGFGASLALTLFVFWLTWRHVLSGHEFPPHTVLVPLFVALAVAQIVIQLFFFLHIGEESKPRLNLAALALALIVVGIVVGGTLWIMHNLEHMQGMPQNIPFMDGQVTPQTEND